MSEANLERFHRHRSGAHWEARRDFQGLFDQGGEIVIHHIGQLFKTHGTTGPNALMIFPHGRHQAVGCHQNGAWEVPELLLLIAPVSAIMPFEVCEFLEFRIRVRRQHLAMRVHV
eukprot:Skav217763  [mRNA]  locus=scaffold1912:17670:24520:+ [translate_table: standard]